MFMAPRAFLMRSEKADMLACAQQDLRNWPVRLLVGLCAVSLTVIITIRDTSKTRRELWQNVLSGQH